MTGLRFELNDAADQWLCKGLRIDRHGIHFGASKGVTWEALDKLRAVVGGQYPVACTHPEGHWFGSYGMGKCQRCDRSQLEVYGPARMAELEDQRKKHADFERQAIQIVIKLLRQKWRIEHGVLLPPDGDDACGLPKPDRTIVFSSRTGVVSTQMLLVGSWLVEKYGHVLTEPEPPDPEPPFPSPSPILPAPRSQQLPWYRRLFQ